MIVCEVRVIRHDGFQGTNTQPYGTLPMQITTNWQLVASTEKPIKIKSYKAATKVNLEEAPPVLKLFGLRLLSSCYACVRACVRACVCEESTAVACPFDSIPNQEEVKSIIVPRLQ